MSRDYPLDTILLPMGGTTVKDAGKMEEIWESSDYIAEEKIDGSRYMNIGGRFFSRRKSVKDGIPVEKTDNVPHLVEIFEKYPNLILDGEVYIEGAKSNDVVSIMGAKMEKALWRQGYGEFKEPLIEGSKGNWRIDSNSDWVEIPRKEVKELLDKEVTPVRYAVYDIIRDIDGNWLMDEDWSTRRGILEEQIETLLNDYPLLAEHVMLVGYVRESKKEYNREIMQQGGEGVMLKNIHGKYFPDKKPRWNWIKVKQEITSDVVITGFKDPVREYNPTKPELLKTWQYWQDDEGDLIVFDGQDRAQEYSKNHGMSVEPVSRFYFNGWIGSVEFSQYNSEGELQYVGFCSGIADDLRKDMSENPDKYLGECMEISAMERTSDGYFRHPQFLRMRPDKNPEECLVGED